MYVFDTDASVVAISGILHQEQEWNGRTVLRPIAYGKKVLIDTEMKYGAPKAEMFEVVTFVESTAHVWGALPLSYAWTTLSVPLSVTKISGNPNLAIQCS